MKKIINGKKYDTETATEIAYCTNSLYSGICGWEETLYRKRTGEFFLYGQGGAASKYAECRNNGGNSTYFSGKKIIPLSESEARKWMEDHASVERYEEIFGEVAE